MAGKRSSALLLVILIIILVFPLGVRASENIPDKIPRIENIPKANNEGELKYIPGEIIVKFKEKASIYKGKSLKPQNTGIKSIDKLNKKHQVKKQEKLFSKNNKQQKNRFGKPLKGKEKFKNIYKLSLPKNKNIMTVIKDYKNDPNVEYAEPNFIVKTTANIPNDPYFASQWHLNNTGQNVNGTNGTPDADIDAPEGWEIATGSNQVVIAILDTGIDYNHEDLNEKIWSNLGEISGNNIDDDINGYIDDIRGYDFIGKDSWSSVPDNNPFDDEGHGTFVAGLAGAIANNSIGVAGVDWHAKLMAVKVMDSQGYGTVTSLVNGLQYAVDNGASVINMSLGGWGSIPQTVADALDYAESNGVISVAASGNNNSDVSWPANHDPVIAVGATDQNDTRTWWSNYGTKLDVVAPGKNMTSTDITGSGGYSDGKYASGGSGTSFSTPIVAGSVSLIFSFDDKLSNYEIRDRLNNYTDDLGDIGYDEYYGFGRVNINKILLAPQLLPDTEGPRVIITYPINGNNAKGILDLYAIADDRITGNSIISEVQYCIDNGPFNPINSTDGNFNSPVENIHTKIDTTVLLNGNHTISILSKDINNNWGSTSTINLNVVNGITFGIFDGYMSEVSVDEVGNQANDWSFNPTITPDGRYIVFVSLASNLTSGDTNGEWDIFRKDLQTSEIIRVSTDSQGNQANRKSLAPSISADGRYVVFYSEASNLVIGTDYQIYRKDLFTGEVLVVSSNSQGNRFYGGFSSEITPDGRFVVFESWDIYRKDLRTGEILLASTDAQGNEANNGCWSPTITPDGRYIGFTSDATNLVTNDTNGKRDIFRKDLQTGDIIRVTTDSQENQSNGSSEGPSISANGEQIVFYSEASNLVKGDANNREDIFRKDSQTGEIIRVSTDTQGKEADNDSYWPYITPDQRYIAFSSYASNLVSTDTDDGNVFRKDMLTGEIIIISTDAGGHAGNSLSEGSSITPDGKYVAFTSFASNLVANDTKSALDVFVADMNILPDRTVPYITSFSVPALSTNVSPSLGFNISWKGSDNSGGSGIDSYNIKYRPHTTTAWSNLYVDNTYWTTKETAPFVGKAGYTYYFKVRTKDKAGNISNWSDSKRTIIPYDNLTFRYSKNWSLSNPKSSYKKTLQYTGKKGEFATLSFRGKSVILIASKGPYGGKVSVYIKNKVNGVWSSYYKVKTIDLYSSTYKKRVPILLKSWTTSSTHRVKLVSTGAKNVNSLGKRVYIDGIGVSK